jgi:hypothetical protein
MVVLATMLATSACDLVFPPGSLSIDGPNGPGIDGPQTVDSPPGTPDADLDAPAPPTDGPPMTDAPQPPDAECSLVCLGNNAANGETGCGPQAVSWCDEPALGTLAPFDLCACTTDPALIVFDVTAGNMRLAFLPPSSNAYFVLVDNTDCFPPTVECSLDAVCTVPPVQLSFYDFIVPSGGAMTFSFWADPSCATNLSGTFFYTP